MRVRNKCFFKNVNNFLTLTLISIVGALKADWVSGKKVTLHFSLLGYNKKKIALFIFNIIISLTDCFSI